VPKSIIKASSVSTREKSYPSVDGVRNVIRRLDAGNEKIRRSRAEELVHDSVVRRLEKDGRF
jgi:hypothetical protein